MPQVKPDWRIPHPSAGRAADLEHIREHQQIAWIAAALSAGALVIGWDLTSVVRNSDGFPTIMAWDNPRTGYGIRIRKLYQGDMVEDIIFEFYTGSTGWEYFDPPKLDVIFDGNGLQTSTRWQEL